MTTPTREQVVQWANDAGAGVPVGCEGEYFLFDLVSLPKLITLARADLEATIAEQAKEIDQGAIQFLDLSAQICSLKKDVQRLQMALADAEALEAGTAEKLTKSQAYAAQLRDAGLRILRNKRGEDDWLILAIDCVALEDALAIQPDETALREHDAKLVEKIVEQVDSFYPKQSLKEIADKIRRGEF